MNIYLKQLSGNIARLIRERWITKTDVEHLEHRAKRLKPCQDYESRGEMWASGSSGDEDLEAVKSTQGMSYSNFNQ